MKESPKPKWLLHFQTPTAIFLLKGLTLFLIWDLVIYPFCITSAIHNWMICSLVNLSATILHWFYPHAIASNSELFINGQHCIHVGIACNGIEAMGVFSCLVLSFSAKWYHKLWMIVFNCVLIFIMNTFRISILAILIFTHHKQAFDINHKYIFNITLYTILLIIFSLWSSKFGTRRPESKTIN